MGLSLLHKRLCLILGHLESGTVQSGTNDPSTNEFAIAHVHNWTARRRRTPLRCLCWPFRRRNREKTSQARCPSQRASGWRKPLWTATPTCNARSFTTANP